jgi:hypothetical protein
MTHKSTLAKRKAAGLCRCGQTPLPGKKMCEACIGKVVVGTRELMRQRKAQGLCRCGNPRADGIRMCRGCADVHVSHVSRSQRRNKGAGLCICGRPPAEGKKSCGGCLDRRHRLTGRHKAQGTCIGCQSRPATAGLVTCETCRAKNREKGFVIRNRYRRAVMDHYGNRCACCGETENEFLTIDHKDNDGAAHRKEVDGATLYRWLMKQGYPANFQILCMNCNWAKGRYGECPHNRLRLASMVV